MLYFESNTFVDHSEDCVKMVISAVGGEFAYRTPELKLLGKDAPIQLEGVRTRFGKHLFRSLRQYNRRLSRRCRTPSLLRQNPVLLKRQTFALGFGRFPAHKGRQALELVNLPRQSCSLLVTLFSIRSSQSVRAKGALPSLKKRFGGEKLQLRLLGLTLVQETLVS